MSPVGLAATDHGAGAAVLLIHGHPFDRTMWLPQLAPLAAAGFRVITPDLRGFGENCTVGHVTHMGDFAADLAELLDRLDVGTAAIIGLSMGGLVAMEFAHAYPQRMWALGLIATTAEPVTMLEAEQRFAMADALAAEGMRPSVRLMSEHLFGAECPPEVISTVERMMSGNNPTGAAAALRGRARRPDYRPWLTEVTVPTFVCVGTADHWSTKTVTDQLIGCLAEPTVLRLEGIGHLPNLEKPEQFNEALISFLDTARPLDF